MKRVILNEIFGVGGGDDDDDDGGVGGDDFLGLSVSLLAFPFASYKCKNG